MSKTKMIQIQVRTAEPLARILGKYEEEQCIGCDGTFHQNSCPAREAWELRHYLTQRINNPTRDFGG